MASTSLLHIVPETGDVEHVHFSPNAFTYKGTTERSREQIATVPIYSAGGCFNEYMQEVATRATKILSGRETLGPEGHDVLSIDQALRSAVSASLDGRMNSPKKPGVHLYPVFLVQIDRPKPGKLWTSSTYGHSQLKTGHPVRSAIHKQLNGRLVLRWVTTWESLL
ncbi:hypothetical protein KCU77_g4879, partial [Aureobasidium melanogenum]